MTRSPEVGGTLPPTSVAEWIEAQRQPPSAVGEHPAFDALMVLMSAGFMIEVLEETWSPISRP